jgi:hypothetical protein
MPDTPANRAAFGSTSTADDSAPFPQLQALMLNDASTRSLPRPPDQRNQQMPHRHRPEPAPRPQGKRPPRVPRRRPRHRRPHRPGRHQRLQHARLTRRSTSPGATRRPPASPEPGCLPTVTKIRKPGTAPPKHPNA